MNPTRDRYRPLWRIATETSGRGSDLIDAVLREAAAELSFTDAAIVTLADQQLITTVRAGADPHSPFIEQQETVARTLLMNDERDDNLARYDDGTICANTFLINDRRHVLIFSRELATAGTRLSTDDRTYLDLVVDLCARILQREESERAMSDLAYGDPLTALPNRRATLLRLDEAIASAMRHEHGVGILYLDLDGFKRVNDSLGHRAGDGVLIEVARRLRKTVRRDEFVGRLGGDEFAVLIPRMRSEAEVQDAAQRVEAELAGRYNIDDHGFDLGVSIGISVYPDDGGDADALVSNADAAMYRAKSRTDTNICWYRDGLAEELRHRREMSDNLRGASIEREFLLCYQPVIEHDTGRVVAAEALLRWMHPSMGLLSPGSFLKLAKSLRLSAQLDAWVLGEALRQATRWSRSGIDTIVTVNVDGIDRPLLDELERILNEEQLDLSKLAIEMSEAAVIADIAQHQGHLAAARSLGVRIGLDRFGAGTTALTTLSALPIDFVKIDRTLVSALPSDPSAERVLRAAIAVAKAFDWTAFVEGIQTKQQRDWFAAAGVMGMQGYAIAQPMTGPDFSRWYEARST